MSDEPTRVCSSFSSDIISDILSRLPVKDLCRFRCVSKSWLSLILDPQFVKMHSKKTIENEDLMYQRRKLLFTDDKYDSLYSFNLDQFLDHYKDHPFLNGTVNCSGDDDAIGDDYDGDLVVTRIKLPGCFGDAEYWRVVSYCCGLVLLLDQLTEEFVVANPATRKYKKLPSVSAQFGGKTLMCDDGFCYDQSADDFKVVNWTSSDDGMDVFVFALKTGSWTRMMRLPFRTGGFKSTGILLNGSLHWVMKRLDDNTRVIVSLNVAEAVVREIPLPPDFDVGQRDLLKLVLFFNDSLGFTTLYGTGTVDEINLTIHSEFWVMKEYGVAESLTKIEFSSDLECFILPFGYWKENHALFCSQEGEQLVMYNSNDLSGHGLSIPGYPTITGAGFYVESLVSLDDNRDFN
ncbi:F-box/kelch-repeat protein At3g06240-like [Argentina anserina]|uniref:F-box/kelch-repeat protein At3g06240-like n=1 Tax=Argentina anserina TaxID=57926 RepID=UPI00217657A4|nr:F-box/kelch-repeat protein At3g06240-like [Potentilla anserina]